MWRGLVVVPPLPELEAQPPPSVVQLDDGRRRVGLAVERQVHDSGRSPRPPVVIGEQDDLLGLADSAGVGVELGSRVGVVEAKGVQHERAVAQPEGVRSRVAVRPVVVRHVPDPALLRPRPAAVGRSGDVQRAVGGVEGLPDAVDADDLVAVEGHHVGQEGALGLESGIGVPVDHAVVEEVEFGHGGCLRGIPWDERRGLYPRRVFGVFAGSPKQFVASPSTDSGQACRIMKGCAPLRQAQGERSAAIPPSEFPPHFTGVETVAVSLEGSLSWRLVWTTAVATRV